MKEKLIASLMMLILLTGCSTVEDGLDASDPYTALKPENETNVIIPSLTYAFNGVWTVNDVTANTANAEVSTGNKDAMFGNYVRFDSYPYQAILESIFPGKKIASVTLSEPVDGKLPFRFLGYSESAIYLEYVSAYEFSSYLFYLRFDVKLEDGSSVILYVNLTQSKSTATVSPKGESFSCVLTVYRIESYEQEGMDVVISKGTFEPELKLKYTSIKRIENATVGN